MDVDTDWAWGEQTVQAHIRDTFCFRVLPYLRAASVRAINKTKPGMRSLTALCHCEQSDDKDTAHEVADGFAAFLDFLALGLSFFPMLNFQVSAVIVRLHALERKSTMSISKPEPLRRKHSTKTDGHILVGWRWDWTGRVFDAVGTLGEVYSLHQGPVAFFMHI